MFRASRFDESLFSFHWLTWICSGASSLNFIVFRNGRSIGWSSGLQFKDQKPETACFGIPRWLALCIQSANRPTIWSGKDTNRERANSVKLIICKMCFFPNSEDQQAHWASACPGWHCWLKNWIDNFQQNRYFRIRHRVNWLAFLSVCLLLYPLVLYWLSSIESIRPNTEAGKGPFRRYAHICSFFAF